MNTTRKNVKTMKCVKCPNIFMIVGKTPIGLAFPRPVAKEWDIGICPIHEQKERKDVPS